MTGGGLLAGSGPGAGSGVLSGGGLMARSPLDGSIVSPGVRELPSQAEMSLRELPFLAQVGLRVDPADEAAMAAVADVLGVRPPTVPNTAPITEDGSGQVLWLGPDEWLVIGEPGTGPALESRLREALNGAGSVVDLSANRTTILVSGPRARDLLAFGCPIDLDERAFGPGRCAQTLLARANVIIVPVGPGPEPAFRILVRPSFAAYLAAWLADAALGLE